MMVFIENDKYLRRCQDFNTEFMPLAFEIYGAASDSVDKLMQSLVSKASERTFVPIMFFSSTGESVFPTRFRI